MRPNRQRRVGKAAGAIVPHAATWRQRCIARLVFILERILTASLRFRWEDRSGLFQSAAAQPVIYCTWHNRLALSMAIFRNHPQRLQPGRRLAGLVSASRDGALLARILENFGVQPVRGSTSRRGPQALLELTGLAQRGYDLAITPDGPRGPRYVMQEGAIALSQLTGLPIVAVTSYARWKICFKSWDRFQIPLPFATCHVIFCEPITIPREATEVEKEALRLELQRRLCGNWPDECRQNSENSSSV
jgi:lysophospholipid acyltransferase (LPLAT)-like uncharacterized protein